nr:hypothetical protein [Tanacetum cinerariifolium]
MSIQEMEDLKQQYLDEMKRLINSEYRDEIKIDKLKGNFNSMSIEINKKEKLQQLKQNEHLDTIPKTKSDEFIKSSVENLIPIPSESEDFSDIESECDMPDCDDSQTTNFSTFSNPLLKDSTSIDDESSHKEFDSLLEEFSDELTHIKSIPLGINETNCDPEEETYFIKRLWYDNSSPHPLEEFVFENSDAEIESFSPSPIPVEDSDSLMEEIDLSFTLDYLLPPGIKDDDYDSERDVLILDELLSNGSLSLPENESFHFDIPSFFRPPRKPPDGNTGILNVKMMGDISKQMVPMPRLMITLVPNQEKFPDLVSHQGLEAIQPFTKGPMMIQRKNTPILDVPLFHFYPP